MSVRIRLRRMGTKKRPFYRFVAADARSPRDGRFREILGYYNPIETPARIVLKEERVYYWLKQGAIPTETVNSLFHQIGLISKWEKIKKGEDVSSVELPQLITERKKKKKTKKRVVKAEAVEEKEEEKEKAEAKPESKESEEVKAETEAKPESKEPDKGKEEKKKEAKETVPETKKSEKEVKEKKPESEGKKSEKKEPQSKNKDSAKGKS